MRWSTDEGSFDQRIYLTTTAPYFGGKRRWFVCDISNERARKLYYVPVRGREGGGWYGRRGLGLAYYSQRLGDADRLMLRAQRIRRKLGSEDGMDDPDDKPKGMHWSTYERELDRAEEYSDAGWARVIAGVLSRA